MHASYPAGFERPGADTGAVDDALHDAEVAELAFKRYMALKRARLKLRAALFWVKLGREVRGADRTQRPLMLPPGDVRLG